MLNSPRGKIALMNEIYEQQVYVPAVTAPAEIRSEKIYLLKSIPLALQSSPEQICGAAHRVGYTYKETYKLPVYRLKLRESLSSKKTATIPGFFILLDGVFVSHQP